MFVRERQKEQEREQERASEHESVCVFVCVCVCVCVCVLPVTVSVMHSGDKTHTGDNADYMHTVYLNTNNHHTSPRSVPHIGHTTTKHTGTESVWRVDFQMQYRGTTRLESREGPLNFGRIHVRPAQAKFV